MNLSVETDRFVEFHQALYSIKTRETVKDMFEFFSESSLKKTQKCTTGGWQCPENIHCQVQGHAETICTW